MIPRILTTTFSGITGATFSVGIGRKVTIPANGVAELSSGAGYTGSVNVYAVYLDPSTGETFKVMPGDLRAVDSAGYAKVLKSFGMIGVEMGTASGQKLRMIAKSVLAERPNQLAPHLTESNSSYTPASIDVNKVPKPNENNRPLAAFADNTAQPNNNLPFSPQPNSLHIRLDNPIIQQGLSAGKPVTMEQEADSISTALLQSSKYEILTMLPHAESELIAPYYQPKFYNFKKKSKKASARHAIEMGLDAGYYGWNISRVKDVNPLPRSGEKNLEAFHLGIHLKGKMAGHFFISSGIQFNQLNSVYQWNQEWDSLSNRLTTIEYSNGEIDSSYSWETTLHHFTHTVKNFNKITTWSIPIDLQYAFQAGQWTISPYAGLQAQFYQRSQGVISGGNNRPSGGPYSSIYKNPLVLSIRTGVNCEFPVGRKTLMFISPTAIIDLMSRVNSPTYPGEIFRQVGIHLRISRRISF